MNERLVILAGLIVGLALVTFPFWYAPRRGVRGQGLSWVGGRSWSCPAASPPAWKTSPI